MINTTQAGLETTLERVGRIISRQFGVTVTIAGSEAKVDLETNTIFLPANWDETKIPLKIMHGLLDHECGHVLWTDPQVLRDFNAQLKRDPGPTRMLHSFWNVVEDVWVERRLSAMYPGCKQNLVNLASWVNAINERTWKDAGVLGRLAYALGECMAGRRKGSEYEADPLMGALFQMMASEVEHGQRCSDSREALAIAKSIYDKIKDLDLNPPKSDKDESSGDQVPEEGESGEFVEREAIAQAADFMEQQAGDSADTPATAETLINALTTSGAVPSGRRSTVERYLVFSEQYDFDTTYAHAKRLSLSKTYSNLVSEIRPVVSSLARALELSLASETADRWVPGARRGKRFDRRRLARWVAGSDNPHLWLQRAGGESIDTAVSLLWDCSGSMSSASYTGSKAALARLAAIVFHEALNRCRSFGVDHEVLGFNTGGVDSKEITELVRTAEAAGQCLEEYSRIEELDARMVFVPWGTTDGRAISLIDGSHANRDGECVLWAAKRLASQPQRRKILLVGSDGHPSGARHYKAERNYLREVVQRVQGAGIEVHALGIQDRAVRSYYPSWEIIDDVKDLPLAIMRQLTKRLTPRRIRDAS